MTERLTKREKNGLAYFPMCFTPPCNGEGCKDENCIFISDVCEQLAEYEELEEQGRLLRLPCKVGDTVYVVTSPFNVFDDIEYDENMKDEVYESYVSSVSFYESGEQYRIYAKATNHFIGVYFRECDFGKTVFLAREEAEAKLKEMEESYEGK
jgi:hypothetical protein